jgi:hypothetical protein
MKIISLRKQVGHFLNRDQFCDACRQFREDRRYEKALQALQGTLWCSHCNNGHKRLLLALLPKSRDASSETEICQRDGTLLRISHPMAKRFADTPITTTLGILTRKIQRKTIEALDKKGQL